VGVPRAARSRAPAAAAVRSRGATPDAAACCRGLEPPIAIGPCRGTGSVPVAGLLLYVCGVPATATPAPICYWMRQIPDAAAAGKPGKARPGHVPRQTDGRTEGEDAAPNILPRAHARPVALCCVHGGFAGSMSTGWLAGSGSAKRALNPHRQTRLTTRRSMRHGHGHGTCTRGGDGPGCQRRSTAISRIYYYRSLQLFSRICLAHLARDGYGRRSWPKRKSSNSGVGGLL
jgi:hypothetical protein